jgi:hypothetical protein
MKKYSADYFEKKFHILFDKLIVKEGFVDAVKKTRKELGIPENGFDKQLELAEYLMNRLSKKEKEETTTIAFMEQYEITHKKRIEESDMERVTKEFLKKLKNDRIIPLAILICFQAHLDNHNDFFTKDPIISRGKENSKLFSKGWALFNKFFALDILDQHIAMQFIEKYLFLGIGGVNEYIKSKVACPHCRYIGVSHFSPEKGNMEGKDKGPFSGTYIFNQGTVKLLSSYFDSVFVVIRPYATKEQVLNYIEDNWNDLKEHMTEKNTFYNQLGVNPNKIKESNFEQNNLIYELYKLSRKDLLKRYRGKRDFSIANVYKETIVSAILEEEYDIKMSTDAIKKSATRFAKSIKVKKEPKDIRDI